MKWTKESAAQGSVKRKVLAFCVYLAAMLAITADGLAQGQEKNARVDRAEKVAMQQMRSIAEATGVLLNVYMDARVTETLAFSTTCERLKDALVNPETREDATRVLTEWQKISEAYDAVLLLDRSGACVLSASARLVGGDLSDDAAFKRAVAGKLTLTDFHKSNVIRHLDPQSGGWTVAVAVPVKERNEVQGVLVSFLKW